MRKLYDWLFVLAIPWLWVRLYVKGDRRYRERRGERFGRVPAGVPKNAIWFHAASAGETIAAAPTIRALARSFPAERFLVTTTTPTGAERASALLGDVATHCYLPYDVTFFVRRFVRHVEPSVLLLVETELWPNLIALTKTSGAPVALMNARMSARSHARYRRLGTAVRGMFEDLDRVFCQYEDSAERFRDLGVGADAITTTGSVKFDIDVGGADPPDGVNDFAASGPVWIAGSTHEGEEAVVVAAHTLVRRACPEARLIIVPRHPERADEVERLATNQGFTCGRLSRAESDRDVLLGDVMGTLLALYGSADVAFLGGSLDDTGGHNPIEPAIYGKPMLMGPERRNFVEVCERFEQAGCLHLVTDAESLAAAVVALLGDRERRQREAAAAQAVVAANRGSRAMLLRGIEQWLAAKAKPSQSD